MNIVACFALKNKHQMTLIIKLNSMLFMKNKIRLNMLTILFLLVVNFTNAQLNKNLYAGIEIGSKGIKVSVLDVDNIKKGDYEIIKFWTENVGIAKGISIDGNLGEEEIQKALNVVKVNLNTIYTEFKVPSENVYLIGSSGVAMAKNYQELISRVKTETGKELSFIDANQEGKMLMKGLIPPNNYKNSLVLDIGGGNTKGGYVDVSDKDEFVFFPVSLNYGSITLTEIVNKKTKTEGIDEYNEKSFDFLPQLRLQTKAMFDSKPKSLKKNSIYLSGGAVWAFYTLSMGMAKDNFCEFKLDDVLNYDVVVKNNFARFKEMAKTDKEVEKVLNTYSQKHLISGSNLLITLLENIPDINSKKIYFSKEGQIAWLVSYISDRSKKVKKIM